MIDWQPIETAPTDGTHVLGCAIGEPESMCVVTVEKIRDHVFVSLTQIGGHAEDNYPAYTITHWVPLPEVKHDELE